MKSQLARLQRWWPALALPTAALPLLWPLAAPGLLLTIDGPLHLLRIGALGRMVGAGLLYPRWMPEMLLGNGYPLFTYYAPGTYYLALAFQAAGLAPQVAFQTTLALLLLATGYGTLHLALDLFGGRRPAALVAAVAAMASPYLLLNLYTRGAVAELGAQALLPWLLWSARRIWRGDQPERDSMIFALLLTALALTHTLSLLLVPPLLAAWLLLHAWLARPTPDFGRRARWTLAALALAMGLSAFFWLPLLLERGYLAERGLAIAREVWLPQSLWEWATALQTSLRYDRFALRPAQLGLVQVVLGIAGFGAGWLCLRRDGRARAEWIFLGAVALVSALFVGAWALPLWELSLAGVIQFPWRLLLLISLPLALFAGALLLPVAHRSPSLQALSGGALLLLLLAAHAPAPAELIWRAPEVVRADAAVLALDEATMGAAAAGEWHSPVQEFRPRWAPAQFVIPDDADLEQPSHGLEITPLERSALDVRLRTSTPETTTVQLAELFFPGRVATLEDGAPLALKPVPPLGFLCFNAPAGNHEITLRWEGTHVQRFAAAISWSALAALLLLWAVRGRRRWSLAALLLVLPIAVWALWPRAPHAVAAPVEELQGHGLRLVGVRFETDDPETARVYAEWQILARPPEELRVEWTVTGADGTLATWRARPWYNLGDAHQWPPGTLIDDVYALALPDGLAAGAYRLSAALVVDANDAAATAAAPPARWVGDFQLGEAVPDAPAPQRPLEIAFGAGWRLAGLDGAQPDLLQPGDRYRVTFHWLPSAFPANDTHTFFHLVDANGHTLAQSDHAPGPLNLPPFVLLPGRTWLDPHSLRIPTDAPSGLYWPTLGIFDKALGERLPPARNQAAPGVTLGPGEVRLEPVKVLNPPRRGPGEPIDAQLGDFARLDRAQVLVPPLLEPGAPLTVTLTFASLQRTAADYTRFVHMVDHSGRLVAQSDGLPTGGLNPTRAWLPGELVLDITHLPWPSPGPQCPCSLFAGLYLPSGERAPAKDAAGQPIADNAIPIGVLPQASR